MSGSDIRFYPFITPKVIGASGTLETQFVLVPQSFRPFREIEQLLQEIKHVEVVWKRVAHLERVVALLGTLPLPQERTFMRLVL